MTVYGPWEEQFLLSETAKLVKAGPKYGAIFEEFYQTGVEPDEDSPHRRLFDVFQNRLRQYNSMTYGMLLVAMARLMPAITERPITQVLVDEAQDIDLLQLRIIRGFQALRGECSLFVVGDQDQAIYEWRGAVPSYISSLQTSFHIYRLENNYRSVADIVAPANALIAKNVRRIEKTMIAARRDRGSLNKVFEAGSLATAEMLAALKREHGSIAALSRTHKLLSSLSLKLSEMGVEHHYCGSTTKVMDTASFRRVHALFKLLHNPFDDFAFAIARPLLGVGDARFLEIMERSLGNYESHFQAWMAAIDQDPQRRIAAAFGKPFARVIETVAELSGDFDSSMALGVARGCAESGMALDQYLDWVATYDIQEEVAEPEKAGLQLMTIHAAKGLEFPVVVVIGLNEGILPSKQAIGRGDVEEERRLAYVAMTRAENHLMLLVRPEETGNGNRRFRNPVSRFLAELNA